MRRDELASRSRKGPAVRLVAVAAAAAALLAAPAEEGRRVALIIGNDAYSMKPLQNAVNDARAINKALIAAGFRTLVRENANKQAMEQAAADFLQNIGPDDTALFFYAGHAVQIEGENYLIPTDFESSRNLIEARFRTFPLEMMFSYLKQSRAENTIVVLDACRSNPVRDAYTLQAGLGIPRAPGRETYVAFSTSPNHVAGDNPDGKNSWFSEALADLIGQDGITIDEVFTRVRMRVEKATRGGQTPWSQTSLTTKFYFHPPKNALAMNDPSIIEQWLRESRTREQSGDWAEALDLLNRAVGQQPGGALEETAKSRIPYVKARLDANTRYDSGQYEASARMFEEALAMDPYAVDAAQGAFRSYLLAEDLPKAVFALKAIRERGTSAASNRADLALKELSAVSPEAADQLKRGKPQPPPIQDLFASRRFGVPDWAAAQRILRQTPAVDLKEWAKQLPEPVRPPEPAAVAASAQPSPAAAGSPESSPAPQGEPVTVASFHVEIKSVAGSRDLINEEFGELNVTSALPNAGIVLDGKPIARQLPFKLKVPAGKYAIKTVDRGQVLGSAEIEVKPGESKNLDIK